jgi:predicted deacylase
MAIYDIDGNELTPGSDAMPNFDLIHTFSAFETDYSTASGAPRVLNISSATFLSTFYDRYLGYNTNGVFVGKKALGKDTSGTYDIYQYEFRPQNYTRTFMISSGMHTYEMPAYFGLARWIQEYMEGTDDVFKWLRENVRVICIPIVNPWGFNQSPKMYGTVNGVNPNRNFDDLNGGWANYQSNNNEWNKKGSSAFSESETQILRDWAFRYSDVAEFYIDCHTGLGCSRANYGDVWLYFNSNNPNASKVNNAINALARHISSTYGVTAKIHTTAPSTDPGLNRNFFTDVAGIPFINPEQAQDADTAYRTVPNNSAIAIQEYATQIHAYVIAQLKE